VTADVVFEIHYVEGIPVVEVVGDVDLTNVYQFESRMEQAAKADRGAVVLSLRQTTYFDSQGVRAVLRIGERLQTNRQRLLVVAPSGTLQRRVLEIGGVDTAFSIYETLEDAVGAGKTLRVSPGGAAKKKDAMGSGQP